MQEKLDWGGISKEGGGWTRTCCFTFQINSTFHSWFAQLLKMVWTKGTWSEKKPKVTLIHEDYVNCLSRLYGAVLQRICWSNTLHPNASHQRRGGILRLGPLSTHSRHRKQTALTQGEQWIYSLLFAEGVFIKAVSIVLVLIFLFLKFCYVLISSYNNTL